MSQQEDVKELLEAGAHFGHRTSRWNPKMRPYIYTKRGGIHIIDLVQTAECIQEAAEFARRTAAGGTQILFTGTKKHIAPVIEEMAREADVPYVVNRWFGGILTNFDTILRRIRYFKRLTQQLESGELHETYNKREVAEFQEERDKMAVSFAGLADMEELPGAVFVSDVNNEKTAVQEANRLGIPVIAVVDSNGDPEPIDYPIPANDDAVKTVSLIARTIADAAVAGRKEREAAAAGTSGKNKSKKSSASEQLGTSAEAASDSGSEPEPEPEPEPKSKPVAGEADEPSVETEQSDSAEEVQTTETAAATSEVPTDTPSAANEATKKKEDA